MTNKIQKLNDLFRNTLIGGKVMLTCGVDALPNEVKAKVVCNTCWFKDFSKDNDPHGEHDFGAFDVDGDKYFWKIDYYDKAMEYGSEDPADPAKTTRVLTIMLASEY